MYDDTFASGILCAIAPSNEQVVVLFEIVDVIVSAYTWAKFPVAPNLAKALVYTASRWSMTVGQTIHMIETCYRIGPDMFAPYKNDLQKYLLLI